MIVAVIVTYNGERWITGALESLGACDAVETIIVVDNGSTDSTRMKVADFPKALLIPNSINVGFGKANNEGIRKALRHGAAHVLLLNQDARVAPDAASLLLKAMAGHPEYGILSPVHMTYDGSAIDSRFLSYLSANPQIVSDIFLRKTEEVYEIPFVNAAAWLISRPTLEKAGGFDPLFFVYGEDHDYCRRTRYHGFKIGIVPSSLAYHFHRVADGESELDLPGLVNWQYSSLIYDLKRPERAFARNCAGLASRYIRESFQRILLRDFRGVAATQIASAKCIAKLPKIGQSYLKSKTQGSHWLD
jgi:GT2 family glycosyltransferase